MAPRTDDRRFGLSRRARRVVLPILAIAAIVVIVGTITGRRGSADEGAGPVVGADLHAVSELGDRTFLGGHSGAGYRSAGNGWTQIASLNDKDVMGWAQSKRSVFAGGHAGLYRSDDGGSTFAPVADLPISDVHALGASEERMYIASPEAGVLTSVDGGRSFTQVSRTGQDFMGTMWVDPKNPDVAIAPSMQAGAIKTSDGGVTWRPLGSSAGSMSVAVRGGGKQMVAVGMRGTQATSDGGMTWKALDVPEGTAAATYTAEGDLEVAGLNGKRAQVYRSVTGTWDPLS